MAGPDGPVRDAGISWDRIRPSASGPSASVPQPLPPAVDPAERDRRLMPYAREVPRLAGVAQLAAHSTCNRAVRGSNPLAGSALTRAFATGVAPE